MANDNEMDILDEMEDGKPTKTQAQVVVGLASDIELFYDSRGNAYGRVEVNGHYEVWNIISEDFKDILTYRYMNTSKDRDKIPGSQAMKDALGALRAKAKMEGKKKDVHVRIAETDGNIFLDLCNDRWQVVEINKKGWRVIDESPVLFRRTKLMHPLPEPEKNGNIEDLKEFINYGTESNFKLIVAWLLSTFKEKSPFPILTLQGEQGSAKSTTTKVLRDLVDPSELPLRALPKDERELAISSNNVWLLTYDNLSGISNQTSDAFCKLSTGGGLATRKLHTNDEEAVFNIMRPTILNGIEDIGRRQDLLDRSIIINLPSIEEDERKDEEAFWKGFKNKQAGILGAICTVLSGAIEALPHTKITNKPRMADFALWITASEKSLGWETGSFMNVYAKNREIAMDQGLESDSFGTAILELMKRKEIFEGNASELLAAVKPYADEQTTRGKHWATIRTVRSRLTRINPALKKKGIIFEPLVNKMNRTLKLKKIGTPLPGDSDKKTIPSKMENGDILI